MKKIMFFLGLVFALPSSFAIDREDIIAYSKKYGEGHYEFKDGTVIFTPFKRSFIPPVAAIDPESHKPPPKLFKKPSPSLKQSSLEEK